MNRIEGFALPFDITKMNRLVDLIYENGPLLSLYQSADDYYLFCWADCDGDNNRWMIFRVGFESLRSYIYGKQTLLDLLTNNPDGFVRFADYCGKGSFPTTTQSLPTKDIPKDYLPEEDSYFAFEITDEIRKIVSSNSFKISIPEKEKSFFLSLVEKLGWKSTAAAF